MPKKKANKSQTNRYEALEVQETEPDEPDTSQVPEATSTTRHTRSASNHNDTSMPFLQVLEQGLNKSITLIDAAKCKAGWWETLHFELRSTLKSLSNRAATLAKNSTDTYPGVQEATAPQARVLTPSPSPDESHLSNRTGPGTHSSFDDVESAVARALPALLKELLAREFKDLRDSLHARPDGHTDDDARSRNVACCPSHPHEPDPPKPAALPQATERDVTISLARVLSTDAVRSLSEAEVKARVETAIALSSPTATCLSTPAVQGVKLLSNGNIRIRTTSEEVRSALTSNPGAWLPSVAEGAQLARDLFTVEVRAVPTTFSPDEPCALQGVYQANAHALPSATSIVSMRWLRELKQEKRSSSLLIVLDGVEAFNNAVYYGISIRGRQCDVCPHVPPPIQCYFCQGWGHTVNACPRKKSNLVIICARCAGPHATGACSCPNRPSCSSLRTCTHIALKCANCGGRHKAFSVDCPARRRAAAEVARQPRHTRALAAYSSSSPRSGGAAASDTRRSLSFSGSPRAGSAWAS